MPSVTYMNQSAPFWDFIASLEQQGQSHPAFSRDRREEGQRGEDAPPFGPWGWPGWGWSHQRAFPFRGPPQHEQSGDEMDTEKVGEKSQEKDVNDENKGEGPSNQSGSDTEGGACGKRGRHGRCGGRKDRRGFKAHGHGGPHEHGHHSGGEFGPRHGRGPHEHGHHSGGEFGPRHGPHPHHGHPHGHHMRGRGRGGPWGGRRRFGGFDPMDFVSSFFENNNTDNEKSGEQDFTPEADIFDTESSFVVHISLPGAKKEDVGVNWDAEKSELSIAGVIYRPGGEEFLKTLAMDERKVGPFERKVRLGTRASPAQIDAEGITAKLEDGVLRVEVPKLEGEFVEVRKVDIE